MLHLSDQSSHITVSCLQEEILLKLNKDDCGFNILANWPLYTFIIAGLLAYHLAMWFEINFSYASLTKI